VTGALSKTWARTSYWEIGSGGITFNMRHVEALSPGLSSQTAIVTEEGNMSRQAKSGIEARVRLLELFWTIANVRWRSRMKDQER
jgi:hypothetical protein